jgi:hypothetical protein
VASKHEQSRRRPDPGGQPGCPRNGHRDDAVRGARDARLGGEFIATTARLTVAAWATAVDGDDTTLAAMGPPGAMYRLMHPVRKPWRVAPGPRVTKIEIWELEADAEPPRLRVMFHFSGPRLFADPGQADTAADSEMLFVGLLNLTLSADGSWPWQLASGHVERFGSSVAIEVQRETTPTRDEAVELGWPAIEEETTRALGEGAWRPSLNWLDVIELLGGMPLS